ncbi:MAG: hypothetical protein KJ018_08190 [Burkholderiales bacterium]|nr:hypothetical protein [Burkholderiales bacterium]
MADKTGSSTDALPPAFRRDEPRAASRELARDGVARRRKTAKAMDVFGGPRAKDACPDAQLLPVLGAIFREVRISGDEAAALESSRGTITVEGEVPQYVEVPCERFPQLRFGLGQPAAVGAVTIQRTGADLPGRLACQWRIGGAVSLILPTAGMTRVGRLRPPQFARVDGVPSALRQLPVDRGNLAAFLGSGSGNQRSGFPIGSSLLHYRNGVLSCTLDLDDTVYRVASTGLLVTFGSLHVSFGDGDPRVDFREGRLWRSR